MSQLSDTYAFSSVDRLREIENEEQQDSPEDSVALSGRIGIRVRNLSFRYQGNERPTIDNLSYDFAPGSHTAIAGPTGQGKSTLVRLLLGLLTPQGGDIILYDDKGSEVTVRGAMRRQFCYVPQGNSLMSGTIRENLLLGKADATDDEMRNALRLAAADFVFEREEGLETSCAEQGNGLSEGQAQRIAIARALLQPGSIVLMDEACSAIDDDTEARILDNLATCLHDRTVIWITHDTSVQQRMHRTLVM